MGELSISDEHGFDLATPLMALLSSTENIVEQIVVIACVSACKNWMPIRGEFWMLIDTKAGMEAARIRGSRIGRRLSMNAEQTEAARRAIEIDQQSVAQVAANYGVHPKTLARLLRDATKPTRSRSASSPEG